MNKKAANIKSSANNLTPHQEKVYGAFFEAVETVGRRLEKSEEDRALLARRLESLENKAMQDTKTGEYYLPVRHGAKNAATPFMSKTAVAASALSIAVAVTSLFIVLTKEPTLSRAQIAALGLAPASQAIYERKTPELKINKTQDSVDSPRADDNRSSLDISDRDLAKNNAVDPVERSANPMIASILDGLEDAPVAEDNNNVTEQTFETTASMAEDEEILTSNIETIEDVPLPEIGVTAAVSNTTPTVEVTDGEPVALAPAKQDITQKVEIATVAKPAVRNTFKSYDISPDAQLDENLKQLEARAFEGVAEAQHDLATVYASGTVGAPNYERAVFWFEQAAESGIANAHYNLGVMAQQGLGQEQDMDKAIIWYKNASELGHPEALYNLAIAYTEGIGTSQDIERGVSYFERAARAGVSQAAYNLGILYESSFLGGIDKATAADWYKTAAEDGHEHAQAAYARVTGDTIETYAGTPEGLSEIATAAGSYDPEELNLVAKIQMMLIQGNYLPSPADGVLTLQTKDAIKAYEKDNGLPVTGVVSPEIFEHMRTVF